MRTKKPVKVRGAGLYRLVFEQSKDSILVLELSERSTPVILYANPAALALHGFERGGLAGKPVTVLGASLARGRLAGPGGKGAFEVRHERPGGEPLITEVTARNVSSGGRLYGILVERDVTWRRRLEEEGRVLSGRIMQEREAEKKRLAAGLHDALGAMQVGLSAELLLLEESVRRGAAGEALAGVARARALLKESAAGLKKSCVESWPPSLAVAGLGAALSELLAAFSRRSGIKTARKISFRGEREVSASPAAIVLYRIAQEALANAERHSGARCVALAAAREGAWLTLEVSDDGKGFSPAARSAVKDCLGLKIMQDAAETAGGYFSVYSAPGKGTRVKAHLPLARGPEGRKL
jgi:PAS domain S-box-containing protein